MEREAIWQEVERIEKDILRIYGSGDMVSREWVVRYVAGAQIRLLSQRARILREGLAW